MSDIADQVAAATAAAQAATAAITSVSTKVDGLAAAMAALTAPAPATVDFTQVLAAIADVKSQLVPTPNAPLDASSRNPAPNVGQSSYADASASADVPPGA